MFAKERTHRSKKYLEWIRQQPCLGCGRKEDVQAHHLIGVDYCGVMGGKADDCWAMPLCPICHDEMHRNPEAQKTQWEMICRTILRAFREGILHG